LRQALFNALGARIQGARVLDLFAGTGAVGLEALSRGASTATFVEADRRAVASLRRNLLTLNLGGRARIVAADVLPTLARFRSARETFDCIFLDPPYAGDLAARCMETLARGELLSENAVLMAQTFHKAVLPDQLGVLRRTWGRRHGESCLTFYAKETGCG
jgi:16S rRNA (guanine(966)-N(2))-methyltransferase RsmD